MAWREVLVVGTALALLGAPAPSRADDASQTKLAVSASAERMLAEDQLVASLEAQAEGDDLPKLQGRINELMSRALEAAKAVQAVKVSTGGYQVYSRDDEGKRRRFVGSQRLELSSMDAGALLELVGRLQEMGLATAGLDYTVSAAARRAAERDLIAPALAELRDKAELVAKAMGMRLAGWDELSVEGAPLPRPMLRATAMAMSAKAPVAEAGEQEISVTVEGTALLAPSP